MAEMPELGTIAVARKLLAILNAIIGDNKTMGSKNRLTFETLALPFHGRGQMAMSASMKNQLHPRRAQKRGLALLSRGRSSVAER